MRLAAVDHVQVQAAQHLGRPRGAEVTGVERADVRAQERLELVHGDPLAGTGIAGVVEAGRAVGVGDLVVGQPAELRGGAERVRARLGAPGRGRDCGGAGRGVAGVAVGCRCVVAGRRRRPTRCSRTRSLRPSTAADVAGDARPAATPTSSARRRSCHRRAARTVTARWRTRSGRSTAGPWNGITRPFRGGCADGQTIAAQLAADGGESRLASVRTGPRTRPG